MGCQIPGSATQELACFRTELERLLLQIDVNSRLNICEDHCIKTNINLVSLNSELKIIYNKLIGNDIPKIGKTLPKEMSFCQKLKFSNLFILATVWRTPLIFHTEAI